MTNQKITTKKIFSWLLLMYMAILPVAHTTALRNLMLFGLLSLLIYAITLKRNSFAIDPLVAFRQIPMALAVWILFLIIFPITAVDPGTAWENLKGQWGQSVLAWGVALGAVAWLGSSGPSLMMLTFASALPVVIHLMLSFLVWSGLLGTIVVSHMSLASVWSAFTGTMSNLSTWQWNPFPWGFRGMDPMHGNLGYAACQTIALLATYLYFAWREQNHVRSWVAVLGISLCFLSVLIASSRGAVLYGVLTLMLALLISNFKSAGAASGRSQPKDKMRAHFFILGSLALVGMLIFTAFRTVTNDSRWVTMVDKIAVGFQAENPVDILCNGTSSEFEEKIRRRYSDHGSDYADALIAGLKTQDGGRILLMRAGVDLTQENPVGIDGSKHTYKKLIEVACGHPPKLEFAHPHQGWIDISLGLGWVGSSLFACMMLYFFNAGIKSNSSEDQSIWSFGLSLICIFWILRGFADGVYREHYLQMQALLIGYLFWRSRNIFERK